MKAKGICIKSYQCEDSIDEYKHGLINEEDIKTFKVGEIGDIVLDLYDKRYWRPICSCLSSQDKESYYSKLEIDLNECIECSFEIQ